MAEEKVAARLTIHRAALMTNEFRKDAADWIRERAKMLTRGELDTITRFQSVVTIVLIRRKEMTKEGRKQIAKWLRGHATDLVKEGINYSMRFTARYWYEDGDYES
ncbi:MAG: hypothetical protein Q6361_03905 [Candidatus Hermodarchaeota archaeon]|nr:hypothetical protein [Candidatus Hermodarchaeota archaeon]